MILRLLLAAAAVAMLSGRSAAEDAYPARTIKLVVGFPPGGPTDVVGRVIGQHLAKELGRPVVVENAGGAGGTIAAANVAKSAPDGYTLLVSVESAQTRGKALYPRIPYDQVASFTFLRKLAKQRNMVLVNPDLPVSSVKELVDHAHAHPDKLNFGGTLGTSSHISATIFNRLYGTKMTFVSYVGGNQPITDLMTGTMQVGFFTEATVAELVRAGKLKALAMLTDERSPAFPDLPTVGESGGRPMDASPWFGVVGPAGLPAPVTKRLAEALDRVSDSPEFQGQIAILGASAIKGSNPRSFESEVVEEIKFWTAWAEEYKPQSN